jgi:acyl carrier protein
MTFDERLRAVFSSVFGIDPSSISDSDSSQTIAEWDSLSHLNLIFAIESEFDVRFEAEEIPTLMSVGAVRRRIAGELDGAQYV